MSIQSLKQLDERIKQVNIRDLVGMNLLAQKIEIRQESRAYNIVYLMLSVYMLLTTVMELPGSSLRDTIFFVLSLVIFLTTAGALIKGGKFAMLALALVASLVGIYNLILINILDNQIHIVNLILGALNILFALYYIRQANHYEVLEKHTAQQSDSNNQLYHDVMKTLSLEKPDKTNSLIVLEELRQEITVWLRPTFVVIYLHHGKRLFFDTNRSFELVINGQDKGGEKINVLASIIDSKRSCSISRYDWLRYIQFAG